MDFLDYRVCRVNILRVGVQKLKNPFKIDRQKISEMPNYKIEAEIKSARLMAYVSLGAGLIVCFTSLFQSFSSNFLESQIGVFVGTEALFLGVAVMFMVFELRYKIELRLRSLLVTSNSEQKEQEKNKN
jgi:hypothetical protein